MQRRSMSDEASRLNVRCTRRVRARVRTYDLHVVRRSTWRARVATAAAAVPQLVSCQPEFRLRNSIASKLRAVAAQAEVGTKIWQNQIELSIAKPRAERNQIESNRIASNRLFV